MSEHGAECPQLPPREEGRRYAAGERGWWEYAYSWHVPEKGYCVVVMKCGTCGVLIAHREPLYSATLDMSRATSRAVV